jgi:STE24 endopeptidase
MKGHRARLPAAVMAAVVAAGVATWLLRPRSGLIEPAPVTAADYFSHAQLEKAHDYADTQRLLGLGGLVLTGGVLVLLVTPPSRRALARLGRRPLLGAAAAGAGISLLLVVVGLPLDAVAHNRSVDVGLSTQDWGPWLADQGKSAAIGAVFAAGGAAIGLALIRRFRRNWWAPAAIAVVAIGAASLWLFPVVVDPIFNRFDKLPRGHLRSEVLTLAKRAHVDVGEVYRVDASRRTTGANAYVNGLGHTKRVVLYDNLIDGYPDDQVRSVVAHELGHEHHHDIYRGLLWLALVAPAGTFLAQALTEPLGVRASGRKPGPEALPALLLALALVGFALGSASNVLSRKIEASADGFSLQLTHDPAAQIALQRKLAVSNVADPDPPRLLQILFGTHPTTLQRIGIGEAWARKQ